jgi:hypothetical protein
MLSFDLNSFDRCIAVFQALWPVNRFYKNKIVRLLREDQISIDLVRKNWSSFVSYFWKKLFAKSGLPAILIA